MCNIFTIFNDKFYKFQDQNDNLRNKRLIRCNALDIYR